ncbi:MAG TPA: FtsX-like permease family protein [Myxococcaceae bacterium]
MSTLKLLLEVAIRNLFKSWVNVIIGGIMLFATFLVVTGGALLDSIDSSMSRSIIGSIAGHAQVYSDRSKEELALFGSMTGEADVAAIDNFTTIRTTLEKHPNVQTVVPMGTNGAIITAGNTADQVLARLRALYRKPAAERQTPEVREQIDAVKAHVRRLSSLLMTELQERRTKMRESTVDPAELEAATRANSEEFWAQFDQDPLASLEFLENRLAPLMVDGDLLFIRYVGTDLDKFQKSFDRMQIVDGTAVPEGKRGMLLSKFFYEEFLKLKVARRLDLIKEARETNQKQIAIDPLLQRYVKESTTQTREISYQLDPSRTQLAVTRLQTVLGSKETDIDKLLSSFFSLTDENFDERYKQFYEQLAPLLELYRIKMGGTLTITAFTKTGYVQNVNVPIYGTYQFSGLEKSPLAGAVNLLDMISFRELYGHLTAEKREEIAELQKKNNVAAVARENAEAELFGGDASTLVADATPGLINEAEEIGPVATSLRTEDLLKRVYSKKDIEEGMVLSAALILKDPTQLDQTLAELQSSPELKEQKLRVVSWQKAAGLIGQFVLLMKVVLWIIIVIMFAVVLAIINNAVMMATLQRVREVGTMRAIGAQRSFILSMVLVETVVLGLVFGGLGALAGSGLITYLGSTGIPASSEELYFFFSGPRLLPTLSIDNLLVAFVLVVGVSVFSTFYPAFLATRVSPVTAMQTDE